MERGSDIWNIFFEECDEQLAGLDAALQRLRDGGHTPDCVNIAFRAVHSIKGGAGIFGLDELVAFADRLETAIGLWRDAALAAEPAFLTLLGRAAATLAALCAAAHIGATPQQDLEFAALAAALEVDALREKFAASSPARDVAASGVVAGLAQPAEPAEADALWSVGFTPGAATPRIAHEIGLLLRELSGFGPLEVTVNRIPVDPQAEILPAQCAAAWSVLINAPCAAAALRDVFAFADDDWNIEFSRLMPAAAPAPEPERAAAPPPEPPEQAADFAAARAQPGAPSRTVRVDLERIDRMIDLVGELVINGSMLGQKLVESGVAHTGGVALAMRDLEQLTREIQDGVMTIRAQPVRAVFQRMTRLVREVAALTGKSARLITEGDDTELDQTVIARIGEPLTHLIRNAVDHGLEDAASRLAASKPAEGVIRLRALHRSGHIVLEVADDGAGLDRPRIRSAAIQRGLIAADAALSDAEIDELIFLPGLSTAATATETSGAGEGMDIVRRSVQTLGGRITIASQPGAGVSFSMSLPLTLAVVDGMVVESAGHILIIPLTAIIETLKPRAANMHAVDGNLQLLALRGGFVPLLDVALKLGLSQRPGIAAESVALLVETERGARAALLVDRIIEQRQVVVKSLETNFRAVPCIAAATVLGDGRVALILDVDAIIPAARASAGRAEPGRSLSPTMQAEAA